MFLSKKCDDATFNILKNPCSWNRCSKCEKRNLRSAKQYGHLKEYYLEKEYSQKPKFHPSSCPCSNKCCKQKSPAAKEYQQCIYQTRKCGEMVKSNLNGVENCISVSKKQDLERQEHHTDHAKELHDEISTSECKNCEALKEESSLQDFQRLLVYEGEKAAKDLDSINELLLREQKLANQRKCLLRRIDYHNEKSDNTTKQDLEAINKLIMKEQQLLKETEMLIRRIDNHNRKYDESDTCELPTQNNIKIEQKGYTESLNDIIPTKINEVNRHRPKSDTSMTPNIKAVNRQSSQIMKLIQSAIQEYVNRLVNNIADKVFSKSDLTATCRSICNCSRKSNDPVLDATYRLLIERKELSKRKKYLLRQIDHHREKCNEIAKRDLEAVNKLLLMEQELIQQKECLLRYINHHKEKSHETPGLLSITKRSCCEGKEQEKTSFEVKSGSASKAQEMSKHASDQYESKEPKLELKLAAGSLDPDQVSVLETKKKVELEIQDTGEQKESCRQTDPHTTDSTETSILKSKSSNKTSTEIDLNKSQDNLKLKRFSAKQKEIRKKASKERDKSSSDVLTKERFARLRQNLQKQLDQQRKKPDETPDLTQIKKSLLEKKESIKQKQYSEHKIDPLQESSGKVEKLLMKEEVSSKPKEHFPTHINIREEKSPDLDKIGNIVTKPQEQKGETEHSPNQFQHPNERPHFILDPQDNEMNKSLSENQELSHENQHLNKANDQIIKSESDQINKLLSKKQDPVKQREHFLDKIDHSKENYNKVKKSLLQKQKQLEQTNNLPERKKDRMEKSDIDESNNSFLTERKPKKQKTHLTEKNNQVVKLDSDQSHLEEPTEDKDYLQKYPIKINKQVVQADADKPLLQEKELPTENRQLLREIHKQPIKEKDKQNFDKIDYHEEKTEEIAKLKLKEPDGIEKHQRTYVDYPKIKKTAESELHTLSGSPSGSLETREILKQTDGNEADVKSDFKPNFHKWKRLEGNKDVIEKSNVKPVNKPILEELPPRKQLSQYTTEQEDIDSMENVKVGHENEHLLAEKGSVQRPSARLRKDMPRYTESIPHTRPIDDSAEHIQSYDKKRTIMGSENIVKEEKSLFKQTDLYEPQRLNKEPKVKSVYKKQEDESFLKEQMKKNQKESFQGPIDSLEGKSGDAELIKNNRDRHKYEITESDMKAINKSVLKKDEDQVQQKESFEIPLDGVSRKSGPLQSLDYVDEKSNGTVSNDSDQSQVKEKGVNIENVPDVPRNENESSTPDTKSGRNTKFEEEVLIKNKQSLQSPNVQGIKSVDTDNLDLRATSKVPLKEYELVNQNEYLHQQLSTIAEKTEQKELKTKTKTIRNKLKGILTSRNECECTYALEKEQSELKENEEKEKASQTGSKVIGATSAKPICECGDNAEQKSMSEKDKLVPKDTFLVKLRKTLSEAIKGCKLKVKKVFNKEWSYFKRINKDSRINLSVKSCDCRSSSSSRYIWKHYSIKSCECKKKKRWRSCKYCSRRRSTWNDCESMALGRAPLLWPYPSMPLGCGAQNTCRAVCSFCSFICGLLIWMPCIIVTILIWKCCCSNC